MKKVCETPSCEGKSVALVNGKAACQDHLPWGVAVQRGRAPGGSVKNVIEGNVTGTVVQVNGDIEIEGDLKF